MRASMVLSEVDSEPTSVFSGAGGTRWLRSPAAIWAAVFSMRLSGRSVRRMMSAESEPPSSTMAMPTVTQYWVRVLMMSIWSDSDRPMNTTPLTVSLFFPSDSTHLNAATRHGDRAACSTLPPAANRSALLFVSPPVSPLPEALPPSFGTTSTPFRSNPPFASFVTVRSIALVVNGLPNMSSVIWLLAGSLGMDTMELPARPATDGTSGVLTLPVNSPFST